MRQPETITDLQGGTVTLPSEGEDGQIYIFLNMKLYHLKYDHGGHLEIEEVNADGSPIPRPGRVTWGDYDTAEPISDINELVGRMK